VARPAGYDRSISTGSHTLVVYVPSPRADAALRELGRTSSALGGRVTVLRLVAQEPESRGCCDTRSVLWNGISRELAREDLARARSALGGDSAFALEAVAYSGRRAADAVIRQALARDVDEVILAAPLGPIERRRLRRRSPVPVHG
jgi:hypothetical protein